MSTRSRLSIVAAALVHLTALGLVAATLVLAGQPIYANDTWIHLALGEAFAAEGPWLAADPHLFAAPAPPSPSSWLGSVAIFALWQLAGFAGLRIVHALAVLGILALVWHGMRRAGAPAIAASAGVAAFIALSTYRLVQLRPDLFTIAATLALFPLLFGPREGPDARRIAAAALLAAVWANAHAAFVLGPGLVLGASAVLGVVSWLPAEPALRADERRRAARLALAGLAMLAATLLNPQGPGAHRAYLASGTQTLGLESVIDEWNPTNLLAWPVPDLPPTLAAWLACWLCVVGLAVACTAWAWDRFRTPVARDGNPPPAPLDPALLALAGAGLLAATRASRFLWLGFFALAALGTLLGRRRSATPALLPTAVLLLFTLGVAALHLQVGDWPIVSRSMRAEVTDYRVPYPTERYNAHAVWFLADSGVEGRVFNDYPLGGFMSFWLAPKLRMASSGTMNVAREAMEANLAIGARQTVRPGEDYAALLDRQGFDLFLGAGFPIEATPGRPIPCTTRHLEHEPGWMLVFRNLRSAVWLRRGARESENLARVADYYARAGVPFDPERGFDAGRAIDAAPAWAFEHGLVPADHAALVAHVRALQQARRVDDQAHRLAMLYATLGLYERALEIDRFIQSVDRGDPLSGWRILWNEIQLGRWEAALAAAQAGGANAWGPTIEQLKRADPSARATLRAHLPVLRLAQIEWLRAGVAVAPARSERPPALP